MRLRLSILFAAVMVITLPTAAQRNIVNRTVVDRTHVGGRPIVSRVPKKIVPVSDNPSLLEGRGISATGARSDAAAFGEGVSVQDITGNNLGVASLFPLGEVFSIFTSGGGGTGIVKPPPGATINPTDELARGLAGLWLYNEGGSATSITEYVSGAQSATSPTMVWGTLPAQTGLPLAGPYVDNITPATRATATFTQSPTVFTDPLFQGGYLGGATWALCFKPADGVNPAYVADNSAQSPPNPTSGAQAYGFLTYINFPGNGGWIGETIYDASGNNLTNTGSTTGKLFQFNASTLPWIFMVCVMPPGVQQGLYVYANLDASGNPIDHLRLMKIVPNADCAHTMASSNAHNATGPIYGINMLGVWGTAGAVGAKEGMTYGAIWNRPLTETGAVNVGDSVTGGEVFDEFAAPCRMTTNSGIGNATIAASETAAFGDGAAINGTAALTPNETASVSENFAINIGQTAGVHPRLFITQADLPHLRAWATSGNKIWTAIQTQAQLSRTDMDKVPSGFMEGDLGYSTGATGPAGSTERAAGLFAFMSLIDPVVANRADWANRVHTLVMYVMNKAVLGYVNTVPETAFRSPSYPISDRGRNDEENLAYAVDWCYATFSPADKATIRTVFKMWCDTMETGSQNGPSSTAPLNSMALLNASDLKHIANNYWSSDGARNLVFFATVLDPADDPDGSLTTFYLQQYWGRWQFLRNWFIQTLGAGGISPEGQEYEGSSMGSAAMSLVAMRLMGYDSSATWADPARLFGDQTRQIDLPYWQQDAVQGFLNLLSNGTTTITSWIGPDLLPQNIGDIQDYRPYDPIHAIGALALLAYDTGNTQLLNDCRWFELHVPQGGTVFHDGYIKGFWSNGLGTSGVFLNYFMYDPTDPNSAAPVDPRPNYPLDFVAVGPHYISSRSGWDLNAAWYSSYNSWSYTNHELMAAGGLSLFRRNEWLTAERDGYGDYHDATDNCNMMSLHGRFADDTHGGNTKGTILGTRGSQWTFNATDPGGNILGSTGGPPVNYSLTPRYVYINTDATLQYQSPRYSATDITQAIRTQMWLKPASSDTSCFIVVYDRAKTDAAAGPQWKREEWGTRALGTVSGNVASCPTPTGQNLYITAVLPASGLTLTPYNPANTTVKAWASSAAENPPTALLYGPNLTTSATGYGFSVGESDVGSKLRGNCRLRIEDPTWPSTMRFLTVLQGADAGVAAITPGTFNSTSGTTFDGVTIATGSAAGIVAVLFYRDPSVAFAGTTFTIPAGSSVVYVTGLAPSTGYTVTNNSGVVTIASGGPTQTDTGGVLTVTP